MKYFIKKALKVTADYSIVLIIFVLLLYSFIAIAGDGFQKWLPVYSAVNFLILFTILYADYKQLGLKERKPQYQLNPYPLKGFFMGITGFVPIIAVIAVLSIIRFDDTLALRLKELAVDGILGPLYFMIKAGGNTFVSHVLAVATVPVIVGLGYLAGYYNFSLRTAFGKKEDKISSVDKAYEPSPWNPAAGKKEKKKK